MGFKQKFGHCNVPRRTAEYQSLGIWCSHLRTSYKQFQNGETPSNKLTPENMQQLEDASFKWSVSTARTFDERYAELMKYKEMVGHFNVPRRSVEYQSLGRWCSHLRTSYKRTQKGQTPNIILTPENMQQLEDAGFKWSLSTSRTFDERYAELMKYKEKVGHCNVPKGESGEYQSLAKWCDNLKTSYKKIQKGETPHHKLTQEHMQQLEDAGFKWGLHQST